MKRRIAFAVALLVIAGMSVHIAVGAEDIKAQLDAANKELAAAFEKKDVDAVANCYTAGAMVFPAGQDIVSGRDAIREYWKASIGMVGRLSLTTIEAEQHADTAIEVGRVEVFDTNGVKLDTSKYVVIWKRVDGKWKLHRDIFNSNGPLN